MDGDFWDYTRRIKVRSIDVLMFHSVRPEIRCLEFPLRSALSFAALCFLLTSCFTFRVHFVLPVRKSAKKKRGIRSFTDFMYLLCVSRPALNQVLQNKPLLAGCRRPLLRCFLLLALNGHGGKRGFPLTPSAAVRCSPEIKAYFCNLYIF